MKIILLTAALIWTTVQLHAQNVIVDTSRTNGIEIADNASLEENIKAEKDNGLVPEMIIILNYVKVIQPEELSKIKKSDISKRYTIKNTSGSGEVASVLIVETRNKEKYK